MAMFRKMFGKLFPQAWAGIDRTQGADYFHKVPAVRLEDLSRAASSQSANLVTKMSFGTGFVSALLPLAARACTTLTCSR